MGRLYINIDTTTHTIPFLKRVCEAGNVVKEMLYPMADMYAGTDVTDVLFDVFCQFSITKSGIFEDFDAKMNKKSENGIQVDYSDRDDFSTASVLWNKWGIDPYRVWIERTREKGMNPWLSFRMNDCHCPYDETSWIRDEVFYEARENGEMLGEEYGYYKNCYNFRFEKYRNKLLSYIKEQLGRYDVYGVELDFMRDATCFRYLHDDMDECRGIMNGYMAEIKAAVSDAEASRGHSIKILVRLPRGRKQSFDMGFDAAFWADAGLVDIIVPTSRWGSSDSGISVDDWKETGAEITVGIETLVDGSVSPMKVMNTETARGQAASYLAAGSDGIYFYNYFSNPDCRSNPDVDIFCHPYPRNYSVYVSCGSLEKLQAMPLRFVVIPQIDDFGGTVEAWNPYKREGNYEFEIITGKLPEGKQGFVIIGFEKGDGDVYINGEKCTGYRNISMSYLPGIGEQPSDYESGNAEYRLYNVHSLSDYVQKIEVKSSDAKVSWVELYTI